jgi:alkanesulfonate monooxygenase SsuD/methylene tetrahydromethanopterin reductase-like flavin-dependent oxidoreductase (luciferase family)
MRLGLHAGYWGLGVSGEEQLRLAKAADDLGYDSIWAAEAYGSDAATVMAWIAANTKRARIASGIFQMPARTPAMTAMTAATLDNISDGRLVLGRGVYGV